jgi:hypothetical protein
MEKHVRLPDTHAELDLPIVKRRPTRIWWTWVQTGMSLKIKSIISKFHKIKIIILNKKMHVYITFILTTGNFHGKIRTYVDYTKIENKNLYIFEP